ncbi:hypothetical protein [Xenophilus sp.]|uniref:hypothetical protein n=1 Tax=Xenophilus sp. TaxID=1873499 RepID=UPI0037DC49BE
MTAFEKTTGMRIVTLLARHGTAKYAGAPQDIRALFKATLPDVRHEMLIADNALPVGHVETDASGATVIGASNAAWEFSAWDSAVTHLGDALDRFDFVHLATSAFRQLYVRYLDRFGSAMLGLVQGRAAAVGHIDYYGQPVSLLGVGCQSWLRTSYVFLPPAEVRLLGSFASVGDGSLFFSDDPTQPFLPEAPVSAEYRKNILGWLTGDGTDQGTEWHSRFVLDARTLPFFKQKALAIFNEQMLSNRLRAQGCVTVDATWLATVAASGAWPRGGPLPPWQLQVSGRDTDAAPPDLRVPE